VALLFFFKQHAKTITMTSINQSINQSKHICKAP